MCRPQKVDICRPQKVDRKKEGEFDFNGQVALGRLHIMTGARTVQGWGRLGGFGESEVSRGSGELGRVRSRTVEIGSRAKAAT